MRNDGKEKRQRGANSAAGADAQPSPPSTHSAQQATLHAPSAHANACANPTGPSGQEQSEQLGHAPRAAAASASAGTGERPAAHAPADDAPGTKIGAGCPTNGAGSGQPAAARGEAGDRYDSIRGITDMNAIGGGQRFGRGSCRKPPTQCAAIS